MKKDTHQLKTAPEPPRQANALAFIEQPSPETLQSVLASGDVAKLTTQQRLQFLAAMCKSLGINPFTQPFQFITLQGKMVIYARKDCTEQLRKIHGVSVEIVKQEVVADILRVTAKASLPSGRFDEDMGAVTIKGLAGDALVNATLKAITKAKRRVTLSICGLGFLDESEIDTAPREAIKPEADPLPEKTVEAQAEVLPPKAEAAPPPAEGRAMDWADLLKGDEWRLVKMPDTSEYAGETVNEVTKTMEHFKVAYAAVQRETDDMQECEARMALDCAYYVRMVAAIEKHGMTVAEVEQRLRDSQCLGDGENLTDIPGFELGDINKTIHGMWAKK